ncbi:phage baseplate assembly protein V [Halomonas llamarensis]|uniref:Phage baseplate assembly protein V n=1 Tax=Halomonas llamarensis TaxID=2945104 RepID=A0ABT0SRS0_9GAMM|nr:phage baseplate assembly protein V [Halomonas llamarensis]MCL7930436.1 phage baseplate assembly protein V [Halomonas llamarensis]
MSQRPLHSAAEMLRLIHNIIRLGTIAEVDHERARVRVKTGDITTGWLRWLEGRAGTTRDWDPPTVDEQVIVFSPGGDMHAAIVVTGLYRTAHPAPSADPDLQRRIYPDGTQQQHNHAESHWHLRVPAGGKIELEIGRTRLTLEDDKTRLYTPDFEAVRT